MDMAEKYVPRRSAPRRCFWSAFSFVFTRKVPAMEQITPTAAMISGMATAETLPTPSILLKASTPRAQVLTMEPT